MHLTHLRFTIAIILLLINTSTSHNFFTVTAIAWIIRHFIEHIYLYEQFTCQQCRLYRSNY